MKDRIPVSLSERWRREAARGLDEKLLEEGLNTLPSIRSSQVRIRPGSIHAEIEGIMGSIHEVNIQTPVLPNKIWPQVVRVLRRSAKMLEALSAGKVPRSFDRLVGRIAGEAIFPESRRVTYACSCADAERPCRHIVAVHELFARRLEDKPWELLIMRGVNLGELLDKARSPAPDEDLPPLSFGTHEEPILFPEGEEGDLDTILSRGQTIRLLGVYSPQVNEATNWALQTYIAGDPAIDEDSAG